MRYDPAAATAHLIPDGTWCHTMIVEAEDKISKQGNEMIVATFRCWGPSQPSDITHYFVGSKPGMFKKMMAVLGMTAAYESGDVSAETIKGREMEVLVKIREDDTGQWDDKNVIAAFRAMPPKAAQPKPANEFNAKTDDGIPF
jgi:hypothetical protein